ncbi:hypothetical protein Pfo_021779 [Paulownia fortunei]|nr:hypothetical protein Pfo_021779 [Paulownia fortunei]
MDSGNSGSMQSSSGGDDQEFDSRGESISSFLNPSPHFGSISATQPPFLAHQNPTFFDPQLSQNLDHSTQYNNDNDLIWSRGLRSEHNYANFGNLTPSSSSLPSRTHSFASAGQGPFPGPSSSVQLRADAEGHASRAPSQSNVIKNPKKRTRASRRAPTTVLTTDTTNFRQMVQEFTGIPAAPFSGSPYSRRLDLFSAASALRSGGHLDTLGPLYPLRPSAHKFLSPFSSSSSPPPPPSLLNSTMIDAIVPTTNIGSSNNNNTMTTTATTLGASTSNNPNNFPLSGDHLLNLQHHSIPLQPSLGKLELGANASMNFGSLSGFLSRETPSAATVQVRNNDDNLSRWRSGETVRSNDGVEDNLVPFDGNINSSDSQHMSGYNLNLAEKGMENVGSSGAEGTVASWICPSD